jgi:chromosome segregation ATPase
MAPTSKLTEKYDEERTRAHEQSQMVYLQGQVDELRRLIKDQTSKYQWVIEQTRKTESAVTQLQGMFEQHREETAQTVERSRRDIIELRKEVSGAIVRIDEGLKPLREMQAQIQQLAEARKQDREQIFPWFARVDALEQRITAVHNQVKEFEDQQRQLAVQLDRLRDADAVAVQEARRVSEELQVERQNVRRQYVELQQLISGSEELVKEHTSRIERVEDLHEHIKLISETMPAQITAVDEKTDATTSEIKRVELALTDWFMMNQERLEELRQQSNEKMGELQDVDEQNLNRLIAWLERLDGWIRELEQRFGRGVSQLEATHYAHAERIAETDKRMIKVLRSLSEAWQEQVVSVEAEQVRMRSLDADSS